MKKFGLNKALRAPEIDSEGFVLHPVYASAQDEAYWTALNSFMSVFEQGFAPAYVVLGMLSSGALHRYGMSVRTEKANLSEHPPADFVTVDWSDSYTRNIKDITVGPKETEIVFDVFPETDNLKGLRVNTGSLAFMDEEAKEGITEAFKNIWSNFDISKPDVRYTRRMTDKQFQSLSVQADNSVWDEDSVTLEGYLDDNYPDVQKVVRIEYELTLIPNTFDPDRDPSAPLPSYQRNTSFYDIRIESHIYIKNDFVAWGTNSKVDRLDKTLATIWLINAHNAFTEDGATGNWPYRASPTKDVVSRVSRNENRSRNFLPRVNAKGWSIQSDGSPFKWPIEYKGSRVNDYINKTAEVIARYKGGERIQNEKKKRAYSLQEMINDEVGKAFNGSTLLVDWVNDACLAVHNGQTYVESIVGAIALDRITEYMWLETDCREHVDTLTQISRKLSTAIRREVSEAWETYNASDLAVEPNADALGPSTIGGQRKDTTVLDLFTQLFVDRGNNNFKLKHLAGLDLDELEGTKTAEQDLKLLYQIKGTFEWAARNVGRIRSTAELQEGNFNSWFLWLIETIGSYPSQADWDMQRREAMTERNKSRKARTADIIEVPNIQLREGSFEALMPHQADVLAVDQQDPLTHVLDVATGGGKALMLILGTLISKKIRKRRVLLKTQAALIPQMVGEINAATNGRVNVVSLRPEHLGLLLKQSRIETADQFVAWVHGMPENTIFINSYTDEESNRTFFDDMDLSPEYGLYSAQAKQYKHLIHMCEFDVVRCDESQTIKNFDSQRSQNTVEVISRANRKGLASGTILNNTVLDMHGQATALNPAVFGDINHMIDRYGIGNGGVILNKKLATKLADRWNDFVCVSSKRRHDWSYLLPDFREHYAYANMTELQTEFYENLMQEAYISVTQALEEINAKGKALDEEELEQRIMVMLQAHLAKVEQFLLAPDEVEEYVNWEQKPSGADLVSPLVRIADGLIKRHIDSGKDGKIMVTAYLRVGSIHFMRHSAYASRFIRYTANDQRAIQQYKENPDIIGLAADATSMKAGLNLQMTSLLLTLQSPWAPGDDEQLLARAYRPDPRGVYNRDYVDRYWILAQTEGGGATLAVTKLARMYSKGISNFAISNRDNARWLKMSGDINELPAIKMLPEVIFGFSNEAAQPYLDGWGVYRQWESQENETNRVRLASRIESTHKVSILNADNKIKDIKTFLKYAMVKIKQAPDLPGSAKVYTPWVPYADPADEYDLGLNLIHDAAVPIGTGVMTEFGPGKITGIKNDSFKVMVSHGEVTLSKHAVAMPTSKEGRQKLDTMLMQIGQYSLVPPGYTKKVSILKRGDGVPEPTPADTKEAVKNVKKQEEAPVDLDAEDIELEAAVVNGMPALISNTESDALEALNDGWKNTTRFVQVSFASWRYAEAFLDRLDEKFSIPSAHMQSLYDAVENMKTGRGMRITTIPNPDNIKNFFLDTRRKLPTGKAKPSAKPYWITYNTKARLAFDVSAHPPEVIRWLATGAKKVVGVKTVTSNKGFWLKFFRNYRDMKNYTLSMVRQMEKEGTGTFDKAAISKQLVAAGRLYQEMKATK